MMRGITGQSERARALWRGCLASALRTALACTIVACVTLYGPAPLRRHISLPAFSYVTVILVVTDASLGDTLRGCWLALYATAQSIGPAILSLWLIGPTKLSSGTTALAVVLASFVVTLPEATHVTARRIALGQIVLVYVIGCIEKEQIDAFMHPLHVAASTAVGALACPLALLLPFPRTSVHEVHQMNAQANFSLERYDPTSAPKPSKSALVGKQLEDADESNSCTHCPCSIHFVCPGFHSLLHVT